MKLLALDTSSLACSVGVQNGERRAVRYEEREREHTRILMPMIREALGDAGLAIEDLDAVVLGNGPGSFIGMRIAASVAQGLAHGAGVPLVPVSSMAAVALAAGRDEEVVAVTQDAHVGEVYLGTYRAGSGSVGALAQERLHAQEPVPEFDKHGEIVAAGFGWQRYPALLQANRERISRVSEELYPRPEALLTLGARKFGARGGIDPADASPAYLRQKVASVPTPKAT